MAGFELLGGLAQGLAAGKGQAKEQAMKKALQDAQITLAKQHAKLYEQQVKTAALNEQWTTQYMGGGLPSGGQSLVPQTAMASGGAVSLPPGLPPSEMAPTLSIPETLAQGQIGGTINPQQQINPQQGVDPFGIFTPQAKQAAVYHRMFGTLPPKPSVTVKELTDGSLMTFVNGQPYQRISGPTKYDKTTAVGSRGQPGVMYMPVPGTGGMPAMPGTVPQPGMGMPQTQQRPQPPPTDIPGFQPTGPGPQDVIKEVPDNVRAELQKSRDALSQLSEMRNIVKHAPDELFGYWAATKHNIYQTEDSAPRAAVRTVLDFAGKAPTPEATDFRVKLETFNSKIRYELYAGNLTPQEAERYQKQALAATTKGQFIAVLDGIESTVLRRTQDRIKEVTGTQKENLERTAGEAVQFKSDIPGDVGKGAKTADELMKQQWEYFNKRKQ